MKLYCVPGRRKKRAGFSLVEGVLSVGVFSFGFLSLAPLLVVGMDGARGARENRATAQIAATLIEEGKQGTLGAGPLYFDATLAPCPSRQGAAYMAQPSATVAAALTRLTLRIVPVNLPGDARTYADVFPTPP
jgi:uncharacterized protein (TIGR02598 family)